MIKKPIKRKIKTNKKCYCCESKSSLSWVDYEKFDQYLSPRGRIIGRNENGMCMKHQRLLAKVMKQARHLGLLPFVTQAVSSH